MEMDMDMDKRPPAEASLLESSAPASPGRKPWERPTMSVMPASSARDGDGETNDGELSS